MKLNWLKNKWVIGAVVLAVGGYLVFGRGGETPVTYETEAVKRGDVIQTVEVTGEMKPDARITLAFQTAGTLERVQAKVGDRVKKGDLLAELDAGDLGFQARRAEAALAIARANLAARLAGETKESVAITQASVDQAKANVEKAETDLDITKQTVEDEYRVAEIALGTARLNLQNGQLSTGKGVKDAQESLKNTLVTAVGAMQNALFDTDLLLGVDNGPANDGFEAVLGITDTGALLQAKTLYGEAKAARVTADAAVKSLGSAPTVETLRSVGATVQASLAKNQQSVEQALRVLAASVNNSVLTLNEQASRKTTLEGHRTNMGAQVANVTAGIQALTTAQLKDSSDLSTLENAVKTAEQNLQIANANRTTKVKTAETNLAIQRAALSSAEASLALKIAPPRSVDVASLRAQVQDAEVAFAQAQDRINDARIFAPVDGIVADIGPELGEQVAPNAMAVVLVNADQYTVEALVPEADIARVEPGQPVQVTLDAYGDDVKFTGKVIAENPDQTKVQDAIYYKTYVTIDPSGRDVKPGMTANLTVETGRKENALYIPSRAIRGRNGTRAIRVLEGDRAIEIQIEVGLRGDEGRVEVTKGVNEGQLVITGESATP